jgi:hypothetical protein
VPDATLHKVLAPMRPDRLAPRTRRIVLQLAGRGDDLFRTGDLKRFESWNPYDRLLIGHGRSFILLGRDSSPGARPAPFFDEEPEATGYLAKSIDGNSTVLWCANGIELLCFDGKTWKQVRRIHDETTKGR